jgi:Copper transport outer membrane protein, MctB
MRGLRFQITAVAVVFTALLAGLLLGALARRGPATRAALDANDATGAQNAQLRDAVNDLTAQLATQERIADGLAPAFLNGRLRGVRVVVLSTPDGHSSVDGVLAMLGTAGAWVTGEVEFTAEYTDPDNAAALLDLATRTWPPGLTGAGLTDGVGASTSLLAAVLLARTPEVSDSDRASVLAAYTSHGFLRLGPPRPEPGDAVVFIGGDSAGPAMLGAVGVLRRAAPLVVAAGAATGLVGQVRADATLSATVSTVDDLGTPAGRLVTVWALADLIGGRTGHYGTGAGATLLPPVPNVP